MLSIKKNVVKNSEIPENINDALRLLIQESSVPAKAQAAFLGKSYSRLISCTSESAEWCDFPAKWIAPLTKLTGNFVLLDFIERECGRVGIPVIDPNQHQGKARDLAQAMMRIATEFGQMAEQIRKALDDGKLSREEVIRCKKETWDLVQETMAVYHSMEESA